MTPSTQVAADTPISWPPAVILANRALQSLSRHAWPSMDGLTVTLGRLWVVLQRHLCLLHHAMLREWMELPWLPCSPDHDDKTYGMCALSSSFDWLPAGRLNRGTGKKIGGQPLRRQLFWDLEHSNIALVAMYVNMPLGEPSTPWKYCGRLIRGCSFEWCHWFSL